MLESIRADHPDMVFEIPELKLFEATEEPQ
jgi:hypothetical protein